MIQKHTNKFLNTIKKGKTEEDIKHAYAKYFDIAYDTSDRHDLYTARILFEFKFDKNFRNLKTRSQIIAQTLYYVRRLKFGGDIEKPIPSVLCLADQNEAIITETSLWKIFYDDVEEKYDWDLAPSIPDRQLVSDIADFPLTKDIHVYNVSEIREFALFAEQLTRYLQNQLTVGFEDKKVIAEENFEQVFKYWNKIFGEAVRNGFKTSRYFVSDIQKNNTIFLKDQSKALFRIGQAGEIKEKKILSKDYEHFWGLYEKVSNADTLRAILAKIDRLTDDTMRRFHGEFFTPVRFAKKALEYIEKTLGKHWWQSGEYRLWDMAAGTGNLEYYLPQDALKYCYLSTLYKEDVEHLSRLFTDARVFQYDYLNDDVENVFADKTGLNFELTWKLPEKLRADLANPKIKWIILINPPFATSGNHIGLGNKTSVNKTKIRQQMLLDDLGSSNEELFTQFLFRIKKEFESRDAHLCLFSTLKYINSDANEKFRIKVFRAKFEAGFVFSASNFQGTKGKFPVGFLIWNISKAQDLSTQNILVDIFDDFVEKIGIKKVTCVKPDKFLSKWAVRPKNNTIVFPPMSSAIEPYRGKVRVDKLSPEGFGYMRSTSNDFQNQNYVFFMSSAYGHGDGWTIAPSNFEQSMIVHAARRIPKATWLNDRDQFMKPEGELSNEFITDCTVWSLFSNSNQTAALKNVEYKKNVYQIRNHFFPFKVAEVKKWSITDSDILLSLATANDTFVADWLTKKELSSEAQAVLEKAREIYKFYFAHLHQMRTTKFKIETWDAGWWQIKQALNDVHLTKKELQELRILHDKLKYKLLSKLREYKIIE